MKFIKLFEHHNSYYEILDEDTFNEVIFDDGVYGKWISFNHTETTQIKSILNKVLHDKDPNRYFKYYHIKKLIVMGEETNAIDIYQPNGNYIDRKLCVYKLPDEWYYVYDTVYYPTNAGGEFLYYKCDQFDGLMRLFEDIL
jgi:hypothetical protein